eukprot:976003-Pelagomonas_calceolata.AAC.1
MHATQLTLGGHCKQASNHTRQHWPARRASTQQPCSTTLFSGYCKRTGAYVEHGQLTLPGHSMHAYMHACSTTSVDIVVGKQGTAHEWVVAGSPHEHAPCAQQESNRHCKLLTSAHAQ